MTENLMPAEVSLCTVTFGPPITYAGRGGIVSVKLTATHTIIHQATGTQIRSGEDLLETVSDGTNLSFHVPHVDQAGFIDSTGATVTNWAYTITGEVKFGKVKIPVDRSFQVFVGQDSVDLDLIPTGAVTPGVTAPSASLLSVAGLTGSPSAQDVVDALETPLSASTEVTASRPIVLGKGNGRRGNALRFFHAALANAAVAPVNVLLIGDSNTEGTRASNTETRWLARLRDSLRAAYQPVGIPGGKGYFPMYYAGGQFPDPWTYTGGTGTNDDFGLGLRSKYLAGTGVTATLTFVGTSAKVFYTKASATGSFEVRIDGSLVATVTTGGFGTVETGVWASSALTRGRHTLAITPTSATQVSIEGAMVFDGDENAGIRVWDGARSGATASQFLTDNAAWHTAVDEVNPHLVVIGLGRNDWSGNTTPEQFKTNMRTLLDDKILAQAPNTSLAFLVAHKTVSGTATTGWADFVPALYELAEEYDAAVIDLNERFGPTVATAAPLALVDADEVHLTDKGSQLYADAVVQDVMPPRPPQRVVTNSLRPYLATVENFPRLGAALGELDLMLSGRMLLSAIHLDPCLVSRIGWVSGTRAAASPTNQWAVLYDRDLNRLAVSADDTTAAWAANTVKTFGIASPYRVLTPGLYYLGLVVVASTVPTFKGVATFNSAPQLAGSDTTNTGLTNPASAPNVATLAAQASHPYAFVS